ncbi:hypothetical protein V1951_16325 [Yersinia sp. 2544 StPb PI]
MRQVTRAASFRQANIAAIFEVAGGIRLRPGGNSKRFGDSAKKSVIPV